jgi:ATP-dependent RNA helicase RhlE
VADDERPYLKAIEKTTRVKLDVVALPENFMDAVRALPKPAAPKKGPSQTPQQQARRADGQRKYQDGQRQQRGTPDRAHRPEGDAPAKRPFNRRRSGGGGVGAHKGAVQRTGAPR